MNPFHVDPDIRKAETLPSEFYTSDGVFEASKERVFARSWQWVGHAPTELPDAGSVVPVNLLGGLLNEPLLLSRQAGGEVQCLSNVCTHRGNLLVAQPGKVRQLVCGYHGRRFDLDGTFRSMPEFDGVEGFPRPCDHLKRFDLKQWAGHLFTALEPAFPLDGVLQAMEERAGFLPLGDFQHDPERDRTFEVAGHWALYCDNFLEGFHIPFVHPDLNAAVDYDQYTTVLFEHCNLQIAHARGEGEVFQLPPGHPEHGQNIAAFYFWVFPNMMFNFYPWGLSVNLIEPIAKDRTRVHFRSYVHDSALLGQGAGGDLDQVEHEDEAVVESVQRGIQSRAYTTGRFSPRREQGVHHFHRLLAACWD
ncbi:MAG: aromatic ring-hydroxylating dioxygenase subunit alpha [Flavobacteriales bacterium]|nr:aromatic ring-hydroxylating dioxygenase subunit alpha [Flavobacteriales bacterium]